MRLPINVSGLVIVVAIGLCSCCLCGRSNCVDNVLITGAPADVPFNAMPDLLLRRVGIPVKELLRGHDHAGSAEAALRSVFIPESLLNAMEFAIGREAFDGDDLCAVGLNR